MNQQRKIIKEIVKEASLVITDVRVLIILLVIDVLESNLLLRIDWIRKYNAELSFRKKILIFKAKS